MQNINVHIVARFEVLVPAAHTAVLPHEIDFLSDLCFRGPVVCDVLDLRKANAAPSRLTRFPLIAKAPNIVLLS
jgi:hypothetical protein